MPESASPSGPAASMALPPVKPLGGSKWASFYAARNAVRVAETTTTIVENVLIYGDGRVSRADTAEPMIGGEAGQVFVLEAGETVSLGQFLTGTLNIALQAQPSLRWAGPALTLRQTDVLARLGRLRDYTPVTAPKLFEKVVTAGFLGGVAPGPAVRLVADRLRLPAAASGAAIAVLPVRQFERFGLVNRASLTAWLRAKRFTVVEPERQKLSELLEMFAAAPFVLLADPRQAGLLGLCQPGTKILEIAPEGWLGSTGHYFSTLFGLAWQPFLACPPSYPLRGALPFGSLVPCSYEVPIRELAVALQTFGDS